MHEATRENANSGTPDLGEVLLRMVAHHGVEPKIRKVGNHLEIVIPISIEAGANLVGASTDWHHDEELPPGIFLRPDQRWRR